MSDDPESDSNLQVPNAKLPSPWRVWRRVVTSEGPDGRAVVIADGEPGNTSIVNNTRLTRLWETATVPTPIPFSEDAGATAGVAYRPGFEGTSFYIAEIPGGEQAPSIPMHTVDTVDYMLILSGRVIYALDTGEEIELQAGDFLVQGGNNHTWINRWDETCVLVFVVLTGKRVPG
jgi:quercetin dioxygenase-like cupin family protein